MTDEVPFGEWLRKRRRASDLTRQALADQVGCAEITLRRIENGTLKPSKELAQILLEKLGIPEFDRPQWILFARGLAGFPTKVVDSFPNKLITNLPASLTTFIGREKEQVEIIKLTRKYRLITLSGPGGVGKTRLSIKVGEQMLGEYANGIWLVELASLNDPTLLPQSVTAVFGIAVQSNTSHTEILINFLRTKNTLLILDNCEHLLRACTQLADTLLKNCPNLKILATSRESLGITGEAAYPVPSLGLPDLEQLLKNFREYESVRLFEERAQLAKIDFLLTLENASSIAQICHRLDGIPLAIELAAAYVNMFSTDQIAMRLNESFNLLTGGSRTALPRQQTIRASIEWGWNLLSDSERILLRRLSVFAGGWILESAQSVCSEAGIEKNEMPDLMSQLVAKSLIVVNQESGHEMHYRLLEMIRQYADEKLIEAGEKETIRTRHLKYFLQLSEQMESELQGPRQAVWHARGFDEVGNVRAALQWADKTDVEAGLYLSGRLAWFWYQFDLREGNDWLLRFLQKSESHAYPRARVSALYTYGRIMTSQQQFGAVRSAAKEGIELSRTLGDQLGELDGLLLLAWQPSNAIQREKLNRQALEMAQALGDVRRQIAALRELGFSEQLNGSQELESWEKAITLLRPLGNWRVLANLLSMLGYYHALNGKVEAAQKYLGEADVLYKKLNIIHVSTHLLSGYGQIALMRGDFDKARAYFHESAKLGVEFGDRQDYLWGRTHLGYVAVREGNLNEGRLLFHETARSFQQDKYEIGVVFSLEGMAGLYIATGKTELAAQLIGWADATREKIGDIRPPIEQADVDKITSTCLATMSEDAFSDAHDEGQKMTLDEAVILALDIKN